MRVAARQDRDIGVQLCARCQVQRHLFRAFLGADDLVVQQFQARGARVGQAGSQPVLEVGTKQAAGNECLLVRRDIAEARFGLLPQPAQEVLR